MISKLKIKYHMFMAKWWHEEAKALSSILKEQRFESPAWNKANDKTLYHLKFIIGE